jgi:hypothetical protein
LQMALLSKSPIRKDEESVDVKLKMEKQVRKKIKYKFVHVII